jgi:hypothetical protein
MCISFMSLAWSGSIECQWAHQLEPDPGVGDRLALGTVSRWLTGRP